MWGILYFFFLLFFAWPYQIAGHYWREVLDFGSPTRWHEWYTWDIQRERPPPELLWTEGLTARLFITTGFVTSISAALFVAPWIGLLFYTVLAIGIAAVTVFLGFASILLSIEPPEDIC